MTLGAGLVNDLARAAALWAGAAGAVYAQGVWRPGSDHAAAAAVGADLRRSCPGAARALAGGQDYCSMHRHGLPSRSRRLPPCKSMVTLIRRLSPAQGRCGRARRRRSPAEEAAEDIAEVAEVEPARAVSAATGACAVIRGQRPQSRTGRSAAFLSGSDKTSFASLISLNFSSASLSPGSCPGDTCVPSFLYALLISSPGALVYAERPRNSLVFQPYALPLLKNTRTSREGMQARAPFRWSSFRLLDACSVVVIHDLVVGVVILLTVGPVSPPGWPPMLASLWRRPGAPAARQLLAHLVERLGQLLGGAP